MNADGGAELRTWKIVVNGASGVASGPIMVSSQLANLTIASPYVGLTFQAASVEQGKEVDMAIKVAKAVDFPGEAQVDARSACPTRSRPTPRRSPRTRPTWSSTSRPTRSRRPAITRACSARWW